MADASTIGILRVLLQADKGEFSPVMKAAVTELVKFGDESTKAGTKAKTAAGGLKGFSDSLSPITRGLQDIGGAANPLTGSLSKLQGVASSLASGVGALGPAGAAAAIGLGALAAGAVAAVAVIGAVGAELIDLTKAAANAGDELFTLSAKTGLSVEALSEFQFVAQQTDTSVESIVASISKLGENLSKGSKDTTKAIAAIGLSVADIRKQAPDQAFKTIITALGQIPDAGKRSAAGVAIFGKQFRQIAQLTQEDFGALSKSAHDLGLVMSTEFAVAGDRFNDAVGAIGSGVDGLKNRIGAAFLPTAVAFVETFRDAFVDALAAAGKGTGGLTTIISDAAIVIGQAMASILEAGAPVVKFLAEFFAGAFIKNLGLVDLLGTVVGAFGKVAAVAGTFDPVLAAVATRADAAAKGLHAFAEAGVVGAANAATSIGVYADAVETAAKKTREGLPAAVKKVRDEIAATAAGMREGQANAGSFGAELEGLAGSQKGAAKAAAEHAESLRDLNAELGSVEARVTQADFIRRAVDGMEDWERANVRTTDSLGNILDVLPRVTAETEDAALQTTILTDAYHELGMKTPAELQKAADAATRAYQQIVASGTATADQVRQAHEKMVEAVNAATGKIPSYWETNIFPRVKNVVETLQTAISGSFAQMMLGAKGFKDGFLDVWESIKAGILNILASIADAFINSFLKGLLGALTGQQGAFSKAFAGLFGGGVPGVGGAGLLGKIPGLGGLFGGGGTAAIPGVTVTPGIPSMAGIGTVVPGTGPAAGAGIGAAGAGLLSGGAGFGLGMLGQNLFGRGTGSAVFGAGTGAAAGAAIAAALAPATMGLSLVIGGVAGLLGGLLKFGPSKEERAARQITGGFKEQTFAGLSDTQRSEAMASGWTDPKAAGTLIAVRDAYLAVGKSAAEAEKDVAAMWAAEVKGPEATQQAMVPILAALDEYRKKTGDAAAADAAHQQVIAAKTAEYQKQADTIRDQMKGLDDELARINATEAPEKHMGTREKMARERIAKEKAKLEAELADLQAKINAVNTTKPQDEFKTMATVGQQAASDIVTTFGQVPAGVAASTGQTVEDFRARFGTMPGIAGSAADGIVSKFGIIPDFVGGVTSDIITTWDRLPAAADSIAGDVNHEFRTMGSGLSPIILKYRFKREGPELPEGGEIPGHALGGVFTRPHVAAIAEGGEAEIVGSVGFMTRALTGALSKVGGTMGGEVNINIYAIDGPSVERVVRTPEFRQAVTSQLRGNIGGFRTEVREATGIR